MTFSTIQDSNQQVDARKLTRDTLITLRYRGRVNVATATELFIDGILNRRLALPPNSVIVVDKFSFAQTVGTTPVILAGTPEIALGSTVSFMGTTFAVTQANVHTLTDLVADDTNDVLQVQVVQGDTVERNWEVYLHIRGCLAHNQEITNTFLFTGVQ